VRVRGESSSAATQLLSIHPRKELDPASMASHDVPVDWATLPNDLVKTISDIFLSMDDLDCYSNFWALRRLALLTKWINPEHSLSREDLVDDAAVTLLNVSTDGCLLKKIRNLIRRCLSSIYRFTQFGLYL
jgi:hypothetical protein